MIEVRIEDGEAVEVRRRYDHYLLGDTPLEATATTHHPDLLTVEIGGQVHQVTVIKRNDDDLYDVRIDGKRTQLRIRSQQAVLLDRIGYKDTDAADAADLKAPMPGLVRSILVQPGQAVTKGQGVLVLEAMKMENVLKAAADGTVAEVPVAEGQAVEKGQLLLKFA